jgi:hypothetical protein
MELLLRCCLTAQPKGQCSTTVFIQSDSRG